MVTFAEFLSLFYEEIEELYESIDMSKNAKKSVVFIMRKYLGNKRYDPVSIMSLFESACISSMSMGSVNRDSIKSRINMEGPKYLIDDDYFYTPDTNFVDIEERARGR